MRFIHARSIPLLSGIMSWLFIMLATGPYASLGSGANLVMFWFVVALLFGISGVIAGILSGFTGLSTRDQILVAAGMAIAGSGAIALAFFLIPIAGMGG